MDEEQTDERDEDPQHLYICATKENHDHTADPFAGNCDARAFALIQFAVLPECARGRTRAPAFVFCARSRTRGKRFARFRALNEL